MAKSPPFFLTTKASYLPEDPLSSLPDVEEATPNYSSLYGSACRNKTINDILERLGLAQFNLLVCQCSKA